MIRSTNNELTEFNNSKKNLKRINETSGFIFVSCPDFSHSSGKYTFRSIGDDIPLTFSLAKSTLLLLAEHKPVSIYLSDHEAERSEVLIQLRTTYEYMKECIGKSADKIKFTFKDCDLLSSLYSYHDVIAVKELVPCDSGLQSALIQWSEDGGTITELTDRYKEKYAQMYALMSYCNKHNLCPLFLYSKFNLNLISNIRRNITIPVLFLDFVDPH